MKYIGARKFLALAAICLALFQFSIIPIIARYRHRYTKRKSSRFILRNNLPVHVHVQCGRAQEYFVRRKFNKLTKHLLRNQLRLVDGIRCKLANAIESRLQGSARYGCSYDDLCTFSSTFNPVMFKSYNITSVLRVQIGILRHFKSIIQKRHRHDKCDRNNLANDVRNSLKPGLRKVIKKLKIIKKEIDRCQGTRDQPDITFSSNIIRDCPEIELANPRCTDDGDRDTFTIFKLLYMVYGKILSDLLLRFTR